MTPKLSRVAYSNFAAFGNSEHDSERDWSLANRCPSDWRAQREGPRACSLRGPVGVSFEVG